MIVETSESEAFADLHRAISEAAEPAMVRDRWGRSWLVVENPDGELVAWSYPTDDEGEPNWVRATGLWFPLDVMHIPGEPDDRGAAEAWLIYAKAGEAAGVSEDDLASLLREMILGEPPEEGYDFGGYARSILAMFGRALVLSGKGSAASAAPEPGEAIRAARTGVLKEAIERVDQVQWYPVVPSADPCDVKSAAKAFLQAMLAVEEKAPKEQELTPGGEVDYHDVIESDLPGMWERSDFE